MRARSNEPIFWALFGAGGTLAALLLPSVIVVTGIAGPLGWLGPDAMSHERALAFVAGWFGKLFAFAVISLTFWHALHRIYHSLHDLGVRRGLGVLKVLCYASAAFATVVTAATLLRLG
jgi:fumarate reductase subunit D